MPSIRTERITNPPAPNQDDLNRRAALTAATHAVDADEVRTFLEALGLMDYAAKQMNRDGSGHLRYRKGQTPDAAS